MGLSVVAERFELHALAGRGGMGAVYRAIDRHDGSVVALKLVEQPQAAERFMQEATTLASLVHPGIVRYIAHGRAPTGELYLAMEWLEGETLGARLSREPLVPAMAMRMLTRVAEALGVAHARGVVHRDLKPDNLFLVGGDPSEVKVLDFGIARGGRFGARLATRTGLILGTPGYMAPEQARGERSVDARADVFALGCVLFESLTGEPAFFGRDVMAVLAKILVEDAPRLREVRPGLPAELEELLVRMLAKAPAERPPDAAAVAAELGRFEGQIATSLPPPPACSGALTTGERRLVSVILVQSLAAYAPTQQAHGLGELTPDPASEPLGDAARSLDGLRALVAPFGAHIERLFGGGMLVVVTGGHAATDQAAQAARCALALRRRLGGELMVLVTGRAELTDRWPVGEAIDRAARLASDSALGGALPGGTVLVDTLTADLLGGFFELSSRGDRHVLVKARDGESIRTLLGKVTRCVGREREIGRLTGIFDDCVEEPAARVAVVTGGAGMGKSRLRREVVEALRDRHPAVEVWGGRCDPSRAGAPLALVASVLARAAGLLDGEPRQAGRSKLAARLGRRLSGEALAHATTYLGEFLGVVSEEPAGETLRIARATPALMSEQIRQACLAWLQAECAAAPMLLVLEDLHWGDGPSVKLIDTLLRDLARAPLMVVAFARPELEDLFPRLWADREVEHVKLRELGRKASEQLVRQVLGDAVDLATLELLVQRAAGNAFFLEELIRAHADGRGGSLPDTVLAMAQLRIAHLPDDARRALRAASVIGEVFWRGAVEALLGGTQPRDAEWLDALVERELLTRRPESRFAGEVEYVFRHALVRDAAYASLTEGDLSTGHALAGEWLEAKGEPEAVVLAEHFERGLLTERAAAGYQRAALQAFARNDFATAVARADKALALGAAGESLREVQVLRGRACVGAARWSDARAAFESALATIPEDALELRAELSTQLSLACGWFDLPAARAYGADALALASRSGRSDLEASALASLGLALTAEGNVRDGIAHYRRALSTDPKLHSVALGIYPQSLYWFGGSGEGVEVARRLIEASRRLNDTTGPMYAAPALGLFQASQGEYGASLRTLRESIEFGTRHGITGLTARAVAMLGGVLLDLCAFEDAERESRRAIALGESLKFPPPVVSANIDLVFLNVYAGRTNVAAEIAPQVAEIVAKSSGWHGWVWSVRFATAEAELALARGDAEAALGHLVAVVGQPADRLRPKYQILGLALRGRAHLALGARDTGLTDLRDAVTRARGRRDPALVLRTAVPLLAVVEEPAVRAWACAAADVIASSLDEPALRATFEQSARVQCVRRGAQAP